MMYALIENGAVAAYPYPLDRLFGDNPHVSFPMSDGQLMLSPAELERWGVVEVEAVEHGADLITQTPVEGLPVLQSGKWRQSWTLQQNSPELILENRLRLADFIAFYDGVIASGAYQAIRAQAQQDLPLLLACTEFVAAFTDAKAGRPNRAAIQQCLSGVIAAAELSADQYAEVQGLLEQARMAEVFTLE
jgi:hypothetical protein